MAEENASTKPPRRLSLQSQNQATLEEAFPSIDPTVVRAVLVASRGDLEPAFNALLSMSDPSAVETPPPQPPRPRAAQPPRTEASFPAEASLPAEALTSTPQSQLDADALYARQLQEHFGAPAPQPHGRTLERLPPRQPRKHQNDESDDDYYHEDSDKDRPSFFEEDLPVIKENIKKGFIETQSKVTGWFNEFKKRIENDTSPEASPAGSARSSGQYARAGAGRRPGLGDGSRRSRDGGYDADPQVLSDDFTHLDMNDNAGGKSVLDHGLFLAFFLTAVAAPRRPKANPNLFQPSSTTGGKRRVSFEERPTTIEDDDDLYRPGSATANRRGSPSPARGASPVGNSKWEPLKTVEPEPMHKDPFSLEDSDDEKDGLIKESETVATKISSVSGPQETGTTKNP